MLFQLSLVLLTIVGCFATILCLLCFAAFSDGDLNKVYSLINSNEQGVESQMGYGLKNRSSFIFGKKNIASRYEAISEEEFWCLVELSSIRSDKIINALHDYLVLNHSRRVCCDRYGVGNGYFGSCIARMEHVIQVVSELFTLYREPCSQ